MCANLLVQFPFARIARLEDGREKMIDGVIVVDFHGRCAGSREATVDDFPKLFTVLRPVSRKFRATTSARLLQHPKARNPANPDCQTFSFKCFRGWRQQFFNFLFASPCNEPVSQYSRSLSTRKTRFPRVFLSTTANHTTSITIRAPPSSQIFWLSREHYRNTIEKLP